MMTEQIVYWIGLVAWALSAFFSFKNMKLKWSQDNGRSFWIHAAWFALSSLATLIYVVLLLYNYGLL